MSNPFTLGISSMHNSSAALLDAEGHVAFALQEERLSRQKNHWSLPEGAIREAVRYAGGSWNDIDGVVFGGIFHPATRTNIDRDTVLSEARKLVTGRMSPKIRIAQLLATIRVRLARDAYFRRCFKTCRQRHTELFQQTFPEACSLPVRFVRHHDAHFGSAAFGSPWAGTSDFLVFTCDGQGDGQCATVRLVRHDGSVEFLSEIADDDSIATLYGWTTLFLGFMIFEHEYKLMGMAPYAEGPRAKAIGRRLGEMYAFEEGRWRLTACTRSADLDESGFFRHLQEIFEFQRFDDVAAGVQLFVEDFLTRWVRHWVETTGVRRIACAGGIFMNVKANMKIMQLDCVDAIWVFPSCGDETNSIGALYQDYFERTGRAPVPVGDLGLGRRYSDAEVEGAVHEFTRTVPGRYTVEKVDDIESRVARLLAEGEIVARFEGREELGARALGRRSLLANPSQWSVVAQINDAIKKRDFWMPFACTILDECADEYIDNPKHVAGDYMILCFPGRNGAQRIVAGTHPRDGTVRAQLLRQSFNPSYWRIVQEFRALTGIGAVLNTSLNIHGQPLVGSPEDALRVLENSGLRTLAIERFLVVKTQSLSSC